MLSQLTTSPPLPLAGSLPVLIVSIGLLLAMLRTSSDPATRFLLTAIWLRLNLSAYANLALMSVGPVTVNALVSICLVAAGLLVLDKQSISRGPIVPIAVLWVLIALSGAINHNLIDAVDTILKYAYFLILIFAFMQSTRASGLAPLMSKLLVLFLVPLLYQLMSLALDIPKAAEADGSASYIGGYGHESAFSIVLVAGMVLAIFHPRLSAISKIAMIVIFTIGVSLANYRTSIIAMAPLLMTALVFGVMQSFIPRQRPLAAVLGLFLLGGALAAVPTLAGDRFDPLFEAIGKSEQLIKPPEQYSEAEKKILSGRAHMWADYFAAWDAGTPRQHWFGFGQDSWQGKFRRYAHNTLFSQLYELGLFGVMANILLWLWMLAAAARIQHPVRPLLVSAHLSFIVLNMATMPFWQVEGVMFYALMCALTFYWLQESRRLEPAVAALDVPERDPLGWRAISG